MLPNEMAISCRLLHSSLVADIATSLSIIIWHKKASFKCVEKLADLPDECELSGTYKNIWDILLC